MWCFQFNPSDGEDEGHRDKLTDEMGTVEALMPDEFLEMAPAVSDNAGDWVPALREDVVGFIPESEHGVETIKGNGKVLISSLDI